MSSSNTELLAIDVGAGTQDILAYDATWPIENCYQLVLPSQTTIVAKRIARATEDGVDIFLHGHLMGGGPAVSAMKRHLRAGLQVFATPEAAKTVRDNPEEVRAVGVQVVGEQPANTLAIRTGDLDLDALRETFALFEVPFPARVAVAVQDHGHALTESQRKFRFRHWREFIQMGGRLLDLAYLEVPPYLTRMRAIQQMVPGALLMDTGPAAIWGALEDPFAVERQARGLLVVNVGNQHTIAFLVRQEIVYGVFEHHTEILSPSSLARYLYRFQSGGLTDEEVYGDGGHGCFIRPEYASEKPFEAIVVTGPNRGLASSVECHTAAPHGDMMMTGAFGLVAAARRLGVVR